MLEDPNLTTIHLFFQDKLIFLSFLKHAKFWSLSIVTMLFLDQEYSIAQQSSIVNFFYFLILYINPSSSALPSLIPLPLPSPHLILITPQRGNGLPQGINSLSHHCI